MNASAGVMPVHVSPETLTVVQRAFQVAEMTDGGFNIAIGPAVDAWRVTESQRIPTESELEALRPLVDLMSVYVDMREQTIYLGKVGIKRIDVGGIGKGYAADQAVRGVAREQRHSRSSGAVRGYQNIRPVAEWKSCFPSVFNTHEKMDRSWPGLIYRTKLFLCRGL